MHQDSSELVSGLIQLQNFSQLTSDSIWLKFFLNLFSQLINARLYSQVFVLRVMSLKPTFLLNQRYGFIRNWVALRSHALGFRNSFIDCSADCSTIKSAYLSRSLVERSPEKSAEPSASSSVDSNTSQSVWSNWYLVWLVNVFLCVGVCVGGGGGYQLRFLWVGDRCPCHHLFEIGCHVLLNLVI